MDTPNEIIEALIDALEYDSMPAHTVWNGGDYYECPSCHERKPEKGHLGGTRIGIEEIEHDEDCELYRAYCEGKTYLESLDDEEET